MQCAFQSSLFQESRVFQDRPNVANYLFQSCMEIKFIAYGAEMYGHTRNVSQIQEQLMYNSQQVLELTSLDPLTSSHTPLHVCENGVESFSGNRGDVTANAGFQLI